MKSAVILFFHLCHYFSFTSLKIMTEKMLQFLCVLILWYYILFRDQPKMILKTFFLCLKTVYDLICLELLWPRR